MAKNKGKGKNKANATEPAVKKATSKENFDNVTFFNSPITCTTTLIRVSLTVIFRLFWIWFCQHQGLS